MAGLLYEETGIDIEYMASGMIGDTRNEQEKQDFLKKSEWSCSLGQEVEWLDVAVLKRMEPLLSTQLFGGVHIPGEH